MTLCPFNYLFLGQDGRIGKTREGTKERVTTFGQELGYEAIYIDKAKDSNEEISSRNIRSLIHSGKLKEAEELLGHPLLDTT